MHEPNTRKGIYKNIATDLLKNDLLDLRQYDPETAEDVTINILEKNLGRYIIIQGTEIK
jgi:hypothetical protein